MLGIKGKSDTLNRILSSCVGGEIADEEATDVRMTRLCAFRVAKVRALALKANRKRTAIVSNIVSGSS